MKIVLDGVETNNKGAELMFYAILQEIERRYPDATVYINAQRVKQGFSYLKTSLKLKDKPIRKIEKWIIKFHLWRATRKLFGDDVFQDIYCIPGSSFYIDDSGFFYSDQWNLPISVINHRKKLLMSHKRWGSKVIFLPQAFGPITQDNIKQGIRDLNEYADVVMPREKTSYNYLVNSGLIDKAKLRLFPDFTCLVKGEIPTGYEHLHNGVCIIPNVRMLDKSDLSFDKYNKFIQNIIRTSIKNGAIPYLLNHEGPDDGELARKFQSISPIPIEVVDNLNALEVKGLISTARLVITSRFHGVASSLNSCVPCLSTSWSHKYEEIFNDYNHKDCVLPVEDSEAVSSVLEKFLDDTFNKKIRADLSALIPEKEKLSRQMWSIVWSL